MDGKSNRERMLKVADEIEEVQERNENPAEYETPEGDPVDDGVKLVIELNRAMKSIQVLGQIVKNFPGSTEKKDKIDIVEECYSLGMRCLGEMLKLIEGREDELLKELADAVMRSKRHADRDAIIEKARGFVFALLELSTFGLIMSVCHAVGSDKLFDVYKVVKENSKNGSFSFIDLAIKCEHMGSFPERDFRELRATTKGKVFPEVLLQILSFEYLYNSYMPADLKQKILALAGIPMEKGKHVYRRDQKFKKR